VDVPAWPARAQAPCSLSMNGIRAASLTGGSPRFTGAKEHRHRRQQIDASVALMAVEAYENAKVARWVRRHGLSSRRAETT
jgi:hypothetical protein